MDLTSTRLGSVYDALGLLLNVLKRTRLRPPYATTVAKYAFGLLLLLNARSLPLAWHVRVLLRPVLAIRLRYLWMRFRTVFMSRQEREKAEDRWLDGLCPVGQHPLEMVVSYSSWASVDDSDFNGHLSNSSYAKTCDAARFKAALKLFPMFFRAGGWMALAATHYHFIREIPMLVSYQVRASVHAWDEKWLYVVLKFVTEPKKSTRQKSQSGSKPKAGEASGQNHLGVDSAPLIASLRTPVAEGELKTVPGTPAELAIMPSAPGAPAIILNGLEFGKIIKNLENDDDNDDGTILHTVMVSQLCFKIGRITIPPALVMAANGLTTPAASTPRPGMYSQENPPPSYVQAKKLMSKPCGGSTRQLREFLKGGWRQVPAGERWWEDAFSGSVEATRRARLDVMEGLRRGLESART